MECGGFTGVLNAGGARTPGRLPIPEPLWAAAAAEVTLEHGVFHTAKALRLEYGKLKRMVQSARPMGEDRSADVCGTGSAPDGRPVGVPHRVRRAARQDADPVERNHGAGSCRAEPDVVGAGVP